MLNSKEYQNAIKKFPISKIKQEQATKLKIKLKTLFSRFAKYPNAEAY